MSVTLGTAPPQDDCNMCHRIIMNSIDALNEYIDAEAMSKVHKTFICARDGVLPPAIRTVEPGQELTDVIKTVSVKPVLCFVRWLTSSGRSAVGHALVSPAFSAMVSITSIQRHGQHHQHSAPWSIFRSLAEPCHKQET